MITDEMLAKAAAEVNDAMLRSLPDECECNHQFSQWFERKMKRVIRRAKHPVMYRAVHRAACFLMIVVLSFATLLAVSPTVRAVVFDWIREQYESFVSYYFDKDTSASDVPSKYCISGLPDDYSEIYWSDEGGNVLGVYADSNGNLLYFSYSTTPENANFNIFKEGYMLKQVSVSGNSADLYISKDPTNSNCIIWCNQNRNVIFYINAMLGERALLELADSVVPLK